MALAVVLVLIVFGSVLFHLLSPWWWTPIASNWSYIDHTLNLTFWITGVVFAVIILFVAYCLIRFHHTKGNPATYEPENKKLELWLTIVTSVAVAALLAPGLFVWHQYVTVPKDADVVEVLGSQWQWSFRLPGKDGKLGIASNEKITAENPFGIDTNDPNGKDDVLVDADDLHLPMDRPVKVLLRSIDVLHNFYVPEFRAKMDLVPGMVTYYWFTPTRTGRFEILCFELCGVGHYTMRSAVVVDEESAYHAWLEERTTFEQSLAGAEDSKDRLTLNASGTGANPAESTTQQ